MAKIRKLQITPKIAPVISVTKELLKLIDTKKQIVYIFIAKSAVQYRFGRRSRIVYIGKTTRKGDRPFESLKKKAAKLMSDKNIKPRVKHIDVVYLKARGRSGADIVDKFERVCLHEFRGYFGKLPYGNIQGNRKLELTNESRFFRIERIIKILRSLG
jgi:hypothetical protein